MLKNRKLTPVEWEIMDAVWNIGGNPSVRNVLELACPNGEKAYTTVQTVMNTLVKKGLLDCKKIGLVNFYTPVFSKKDIVKTEMTSLVSRIFNGSIPALANFLIDSDELSLEDIQKIRQRLDKKENDLKG